MFSPDKVDTTTWKYWSSLFLTTVSDQPTIVVVKFSIILSGRIEVYFIPLILVIVRAFMAWMGRWRRGLSSRLEADFCICEKITTWIGEVGATNGLCESYILMVLQSAGSSPQKESPWADILTLNEIALQFESKLLAVDQTLWYLVWAVVCYFVHVTSELERNEKIWFIKRNLPIQLWNQW